MVAETTRILSDLHYGHPSSRVQRLEALRPLFAGADRVVFNGDSLETRSGPASERSAEYRERFLEFVLREAPRCTLLTGNHDADLSDHHYLDLVGGLMLVTHGEVFFDDLVPWSPDQPQIRDLYRQELAALPADVRDRPEERLAAGKRACARMKLGRDPHTRNLWQRGLRTAHFVGAPRRTWAMFRAWSEMPNRAAAFARRFRPHARFVVVGHTHRPGIWFPGNLIVINTGSFCPPFGGYLVDVSLTAVVARRVARDRDVFRPGRVVAAFALAPDEDNVEGAAMPSPVPAP